MRKLIKTILREGIGERSWTSEYDRMKWVVEDFDRMLRDLYPFWWMNEVDGKRMMSSLGVILDMNFPGNSRFSKQRPYSGYNIDLKKFFPENFIFI